MKLVPQTKFVMLLLFLGLLSACSSEQQVKTIHKEEVAETIDAWLNLWATYDLDLVEKIFWNDPAATYFSSEKEGLIKGYASFIPHHEGFGFVRGGKPAEKSLWLEEINTTIHDRTAVVEAIWYFGDSTIPREQVQNGPVSFVLLLDKNADVKIAHTHFANYESWKTAGN